MTTTATQAPREAPTTCTWFLLFWAVAALSMVSPAAAQSDEQQEQWEAPAECPTRSDFELQVADSLGEALDSVASALAQVHVQIARGSDGTLSLSLSIGSAPTEERVHSSQDCQALVEAAALTVALSLSPAERGSGTRAKQSPTQPPSVNAPRVARDSADAPGERAESVTVEGPPTAMPESPAAADATPGKPAAVTPPTAVAEAAPEPAVVEPNADPDEADSYERRARRAEFRRRSRNSAPKPRFDVSWGALLDVAALPRPRAGPSVAAGLSRGRLRADLTTLWLPPARETTPATSVQIQLVAAGLRACGLLFRIPIGERSLGLWACPLAEAGILITRGQDGIDGPPRSLGAWAAMGGGMQAALALRSGWAMSLDGGVLSLLARPRVVGKTPGGDLVTLYRQPAVTGRVGLAFHKDL